MPLESQNRFDGQVAIITGSTGGIGQAVVYELYESGMNVVLLSRDITKLRKIFKDLDQKRILFIAGDAARESDVKELFKKAEDKFGKVNALVNCLGIFSQGEIEGLEVKDFEKVFDTNVKSIFLTSRSAVAAMKKAKGGTIINIGSRIVNNSNIGPGKTLYTASKTAVDGFSRSLAAEVAKDKIRVICLNPATISTFVTKDILKYMLPEEVAKIVAFVLGMTGISFDSISFKSINQNI